jgi:hypothetical protein
MDMKIKQEQGHPACAWTCSVDMGMKHGYGHAALGPLQHCSAAYCFSQNFFYFYSPSPLMQAADGGCPGLLLQAISSDI